MASGLRESSGMYLVVALVALLALLSECSGSLDVQSCASVAEVFAKNVDSKVHVPNSPIPDAYLSVCSDILSHTGGHSCCTEEMEAAMLRESSEYLQDHIRMNSQQLAARIKQSRDLFEDHLRQSMTESRNKTSTTLTNLFGIPESEHTAALDSLMSSLEKFFQGEDGLSAEEIVRRFFVDLFPPVFEYVLRDRQHVHQKSVPTGDAFKTCLKRVYDQVDPFGSIARMFSMRLKFSFKRARLFAQSLDVLALTLDLAEQADGLDKSCEKAISRLHYCPMCAAKEESRPCRGLCLNVMRGCLSKICELSGYWDDLVVAFENLHMGMFFTHNAQELMAHMDTNVSDAVLRSMDEGASLYNEVMSLCRQSATSSTPASSHGEGTERHTRFPKEVLLSQGSSLTSSVHPAHETRDKNMRSDVDSLVKLLENSKGFLNRLPDNLCRVPVYYDQEMDSDRCWNGSAIGRYMNFVPEVNMLSQVKHNKEVTVSLVADNEILSVREMLMHMRRNLSSLLNEEVMLSDESYRRIDETLMGSGSGGYYSGSSSGSPDVSVDFGDDEDYDGWDPGNYDYYSGSGSGEGSMETGPEGDTETPTSGPGNKNRNKNKDRQPGSLPDAQQETADRPRSNNPRDGASPTLTVSFTLLLLATFTSWSVGFRVFPYRILIL